MVVIMKCLIIIAVSLFVGFGIGHQWQNYYKDIELSLYLDNEYQGGMGFNNGSQFNKYLKGAGAFWILTLPDNTPPKCVREITIYAK